MSIILDGEEAKLRAKISVLEVELKALDAEIEALEAKRSGILSARSNAYQDLKNKVYTEIFGNSASFDDYEYHRRHR